MSSFMPIASDGRGKRRSCECEICGSYTTHIFNKDFKVKYVSSNKWMMNKYSSDDVYAIIDRIHSHIHSKRNGSLCSLCINSIMMIGISKYSFEEVISSYSSSAMLKNKAISASESALDSIIYDSTSEIVDMNDVASYYKEIAPLYIETILKSRNTYRAMNSFILEMPLLIIDVLNDRLDNGHDNLIPLRKANIVVGMSVTKFNGIRDKFNEVVIDRRVYFTPDELIDYAQNY